MSDPLSGLTLHMGNRLELLMDALAESSAVPLSDPFSPDIVMVQSRGMAHWVSMELARRLGICSNVAFPFPNAFLEMLYDAVAPDMPDASPFEPVPMAFRLFAMMEKETSRKGPLGGYLMEDDTGLKRYQLSVKLADRFDQYQIYRPEMIARWDSGDTSGDEDESWQQRLWSGLVRQTGVPHRTARLRLTIHALTSGSLPDHRLPERLAVFGISYLPPSFFHILNALALRIPVHLYVLSPTREYWGDILSEAEQARIKRRYPRSGAPGGLHLDVGNRLLSTMGGMGRDFFTLAVSSESDMVDHFIDPGRATLLHRVQTDILNLCEPSEPDVSPTGDKGDVSIQIHACHGPRREVEVLHDRLTALFETTPDLDPSDVLVMTPDIDCYAPFIQAVFEADADPKRRIPFAIADRGFEGEFRLGESFLGLLDMKEARMTVSQVMGLLEDERVRDRFDITESDIELIGEWIDGAAIRWGENSQARERAGLPPAEAHTWQQGLDRLLSGMAMSPDALGQEVTGLYPSKGPEGREASVLGRFMTFLETLFAFCHTLRQSHRLSQWAEILNRALDSFWRFTAADQSVAMRIRGYLRELVDGETHSGCRERIRLEVIRAFLGGRMAADQRPGGFISGGVTFCAMLPMRSIPSKVICLIGMDDERFPREDRLPGFDLVSRRPKRGDRSRRMDDRYLFLEALLSARRCFYISYTGQSIKDDGYLPPSVVVSELVDALTALYGIEASRLVVRHRLQPWSPAYFEDGSSVPTSFSERHLTAARAQMAAKQQPASEPPFFRKPLPEPNHEWRSVGIDDLCRFFTNPCRYFIQRRLGVVLKKGRRYEDTESFRLVGLDRFAIGTDMVAQAMGGEGPGRLYDRFRGEGRLPEGPSGRIAFFTVWSDALKLAKKASGVIGAADTRKIDIDIRLGPFDMVGTLESIHDSGQSMVRYAKLRSPHLLTAWIRHLAFCLCGPEDLPKHTVLVTRDQRIRLLPVADPAAGMEAMLKWYWEGLRMPLPLYDAASLGFAQRMVQKAAPIDYALERAAGDLIGTPFRRGDMDDPYVFLSTRGRNPIDTLFQTVALGVFEPIFAHLSVDG